MLNRVWSVIALLVVMVALVAFAAYGGLFETTNPTSSPQSTASIAGPSTPPPSRPTPPPSAGPSPTPVDTGIHAQGTVVPLRSADLGVSIGGVVANVYVAQGQRVVVGQLLLTLDQTTYLAQEDVARATVRRGQAAVDRATLQVQQLPIDPAPGQAESAQAELRLALTELDLAQAQLAEAQALLSQTELHAPIAGTIAAIDAASGTQARAGEALITIADTSAWRIETTDVTELEIVRIAVGDRATIVFPALPDVTVSGRVESIQIRGTTSDGEVKFAVSIEPDSHLSDLRWNMTAEVRIAPSG